LFEEDADDKTYAKCLHCKSRIKRGKDKCCFSTSPLMKHAETHHREVFMKEKEAAEAAAKQKDAESKQPPPKKQKNGFTADSTPEPNAFARIFHPS